MTPTLSRRETEALHLIAPYLDRNERFKNEALAIRMNWSAQNFGDVLAKFIEMGIIRRVVRGHYAWVHRPDGLVVADEAPPPAIVSSAVKEDRGIAPIPLSRLMGGRA